jgi:hypothetical protein
MKTVKMVMAVVIGVALMASTGLAAEKKYSGFLGDTYKNLQPGPKDGVKERWLKPGVMFGKYNKFMVDSVIFFFADDSEYKGIDPNELKELSDGFNQAMVAAFKDKYPMVTEPAPDVARIRIAITAIKASKPAASGVSSLLPVGIAFSVVKKGVTGSWSGSGATSAEMEIRDSLTNDVIGAAVDDRTAGYTERFSKWGSAQEAFKFWSERIVGFINDTRDMK